VQREKMIRAEEAARAVWFLCQQPASGVVSEMVLPALQSPGHLIRSIRDGALNTYKYKRRHLTPFIFI